MAPTTFGELVNIFINLIQATLPLLMGLSLLVFVWGLVKFISRAGGDEKAVTDGKKLMMWGLIALFVMISIWGILRFFYSSLGFSKTFGLPLLP
ncbi:MAG: hypothetical protein A3C70_02960 [Candidatus Zambryskibacteria bacterium RIFCSPHIGHO2_02_FULL_43_14]|uniref:Uncharacterized protein n=1 Tax=Candidatus Zambryskibacteria bacterium RIFCSPHIGHO2_02_FULL_43_14 TaxID=1802748 RepID=A0A1G2TH51_9BACT|nr:MAG: hypothetical protein A2829_00475 [Candidatus Zambryskibacteria bacterium RIFCSPHIGHO2_01_FULL_43_60]OHA95941.1 MAG: hypothetical protein A3C70_02960 [Candidatus Zambryskibacteria bacterium RIFCSPHIGHO2_02_FULL_43_14]OHB03635.1 MAG: hypothetical protein A3B03_02865 [Candidatus Zambryskibacteria bacterium RIFCSPLOWO2_01_FULL_42_41]